MNSTAIASHSATNPDVSAGIAQFLSPVVIELTAIAVNGKQAHWHVRGPNFAGVHELLDVIVDHAHEWADLAAERVVALGLPIDARIATIADKTTSRPLSAGFQQSDTTVAEMVAQLDTALVAVRSAVDGLDGVDLTSQDVAIEIARGLDKDRWFLSAHISK